MVQGIEGFPSKLQPSLLSDLEGFGHPPIAIEQAGMPTKTPEEGLKMAYREMRMADIDQVTRRWLAGEKIRAIARSTGSDRNTVRRIVRFAAEAGIRADTP